MAEKNQVDLDLDDITKKADRLKLRGKDREDYIHKHMVGFGYKAKRTYFQPEDDDEDNGGGFFGRRRRRDDDDDDDV